MLHIVADVFSGRPNPSWLITDEAEVRAIQRELAQNSAMTSDTAPGDAGLGLRGFRIAASSDETVSADQGIGGYLAVGPRAPRAAHGLAERLIGLLPRDTSADAVGETGDLAQYLLSQLSSAGHASVTDSHGAEEAPRAGTETSDAAHAAALIRCTIELGAFNPGFWNQPAVQPHNNCYNYASNKRTDSFAQPGRASGHMYAGLNCPAVTAAALSDGLHHRFVCFPDSERPRYLMALVIAPNQDYHWYRKQKEGFWGHKPGGTAARNTDNSGHIVTNPETANRGPYTQFCGYFYSCRSQRIH